MASAEEAEALFERYQELLDINEAMDGDNYESNILKQLNVAQMGDLKETGLSQISGGEYQISLPLKMSTVGLSRYSGPAGTLSSPRT